MQPDLESQAFESFRRRVLQVEEEVHAIDQQLARRDVLALAHRGREACRQTRDLLAKNVEILFEGKPRRFHQDLSDHLDFAEGHITKALSDEIEFQAMEQRLYLATRLTEDVLSHVRSALVEMERRLIERSRVCDGRRRPAAG